SVSWHSFLLPHLRELHSISISPSIPRASVWTTKVYSSNGSLATTLATPCRQAWLPPQEYLVSLQHGPARIGTGSLERCLYLRTCPIPSSASCRRTTNWKQSRQRMQARSRVPCLCCGGSCMPSERCSVFLQLWHICGPSSKGSRSARQDSL